MLRTIITILLLVTTNEATAMGRAYAQATPVPQQSQSTQSTMDLMVTVGDSISAGYLSDWRATHKIEDEKTNAAQAAKDDQIDEILKGEAALKDVPVDVSTPPDHPRHTRPYWLLRLGQIFNNKYTLSWSSGQNIRSHHALLKEYLSKREPEVYLETYNVAMSGAVTADLTDQANQILAAWNTGRYRNIRYITVTIGANDACAPWHEGGNPESEIQYNIHQFFKALSVIHQKEPIRVLFSSIPRIPDLGRPEIMNHYLTRKMSCEYRTQMKDDYCNSLLVWKTEEEYQKNIGIIASKNEAIRSVLKQINHEMPQFDIAFSESLYKRKIRIDLLSKDCFHPNADGQDEISEQLWADQPWFK